MLSILIPTHNSDVFQLVKEVYQQCVSEKIDFEIIVLDDASQNFQEENNKINDFNNCTYFVLNQNIGRAAARNSLAKQARYTNLLFLDADVMPRDKYFIQRYLVLCNQLINNAYFGGYCYTNKSLNNTNRLRYFYGKKREEKPAVIRNLTPLGYVFSGNFLIDKECFLRLQIPNVNVYGMDIYFAYLLKKNNYHVQHINNEIIHLGVENNELFLKKALVSVQYRKENWVNIPEILEINKLLRWYNKLKVVNGLMKSCFIVIRKPLKYLFFKSKPCLWAFDLYRLLYLFKSN